MSSEDIFNRIVSESVDARQQGTRFEYAVKYFLEHDPAWKDRLRQVWLWHDAPTNPGRKDTGIDLVALDGDGTYWAIQAKCYQPGHKLSYTNLSTFFASALADSRYTHYMVADTSAGFTGDLQHYMDGLNADGRDAVRLDQDTMREANVDWEAFWNGKPDTTRRTVFEPRPHQREAIDKIAAELKDHDRCTAVMACGTGKTLTSLRLAEEMLGPGGTVLFLAPSISLVSQVMRNWVNQVRDKIHVYVVCSDTSASSVAKDGENAEAYGQLSDIPFPATTSPETVANRFRPRPDALNVIFSTYQSIDVIHQAQKLGLCGFDLAICDEAHRTTGVIDGEGAFQRIHDPAFIGSAKRLYMTATPRIFGEDAKHKADMNTIALASMDDEQTYGRVAYRLGFGKAVDQGLLTDYKIVIMQVSEGVFSKTSREVFNKKDFEVDLPDAAKFIGVWKALYDRHGAKTLEDIVGRGKHAAHADNEERDRALRHAITFCSTIKASKAMTAKFNEVVAMYREDLKASTGSNSLDPIHVDVDHVDGTMPAKERKAKLEWLGERVPRNECHVLSNARCLAEGVDVPGLDAVIYLNARRSKVDIIQSVGRVMRTAPGKEYGYIIIPVVVPEGADADTVLSSSAYNVVWDVVRALRSHDERLDAIINSAHLGDTSALARIVEVEVLGENKVAKRKHKTATPGSHTSGAKVGDSDPDTDESAKYQGELDLDVPDSVIEAITAHIVRKCGTKMYWGEWTGDIATITTQRARQIDRLVHEDARAREEFDRFVQGLRDSLNPSYTDMDAIGVLAQHEVTKPIFATLFTDRSVLDHNPIIRGLDRVLDALYSAGLPTLADNPTLRDLYASVNLAAGQLDSDIAKQNLIKEIYNDFFTKAFADTADQLGIVYTPVEVVDAQLHMVQRALQREFNERLGDRNVHVLDGFAGTGTYLCRLIEDETLINEAELPYKYSHDLHSNEIVPLAATIMNINIEQSYHKRVRGDYRPFTGGLLTDTFQMHEEGDTMDDAVFTENTERVRGQLDAPIRIIVGNPPYRAGDKDNTGNQNTGYPHLDSRIEQTYVAKSDATLNNSLYDHYIRAFRWATDRIGTSGIICFVSNGGWLEGKAGAGFRRSLVEEFNSIYVYNLRGNQRTQGETSRREGGKIFESGSRATIAITMLVKNPASTEHGVVRYRDIGDYLTRQNKLDILKECVEGDPEWTILEPDGHGDWLNQRDDSFNRFMPMGVQKGVKKTADGVFSIWSAGIKTNRDPWAYNSSKLTLERDMRLLIDTYNSELQRWKDAAKPKDVKKFVTNDDTKIKWTREVYQDLAHEKFGAYEPSHVRVAMYRPFFKQWAYMDPMFNNCVYLQPLLFPYEGVENLVIDTSERGAFISGILPDLELVHHGQCFPLYWYEETGAEPTLDTATDVDGHGYVRHDAISDETLEVFREAYPHTRITKKDIFHYMYAVLNNREYQARFANNLGKELPHIPLAKDYKAFRDAGYQLADLHVNYEEQERWNVVETGDKADPGPTAKITYPVKVKDPETGKKVPDRTIMQVTENLRIDGIPLRAYDYMVNGRSALDWLIDRYKITKDKKSGIINNPNEFSDDPRYIVDLVEKIITVSMRTLDILDQMPPLEELPQTANWPDAWKFDA